MEKVILPREVADAIDTISRMDNWKLRMMECMFDDQRTLSKEMSIVKTFFHMTGTSGIQIMEALVNGYEVEETPEDKVHDYIKRLRNMRDHTYTSKEDSEKLNLEVNGALQVLEHLNIKITGVNE